MGRIAPYTHKKTQVKQEGCYPHLRSPAPLPNSNGHRHLFLKLYRLTQITDSLSKLWHLPDSFDWMAPLPPQHRRWLCAMAMILLLVLFWPSSASLESHGWLQPQYTENLVFTPHRPDVTSQQAKINWAKYPIQPEQTVPQLSRKHQVNVNGRFVMEQVSSYNKPRIKLQTGQYIQTQHGAQEQVTELKIKKPKHQLVILQR